MKIGIVLGGLLGLVPWTAHAQAVGVVTTTQGQVTVARPAAPPALVKFREDVFIRDRIATGERSLARILFGGKAVVTVTERSVVTITDRPTTSIINAGPGRLAIAVARERMAPGEAIEIRTPHAVAAIRGTVVVVEVVEAPDTPDGYLTRFTLIKGAVDVQAIDAPTRAPIGAPVPMQARDAVTVDARGVTSTRRLSRPETDRVAARFRVAPGSHPVRTRDVAELVKATAGEHVRQAMQHASELERERGHGAHDGIRGRGVGNGRYAFPAGLASETDVRALDTLKNDTTRTLGRSDAMRELQRALQDAKVNGKDKDKKN